MLSADRLRFAVPAADSATWNMLAVLVILADRRFGPLPPRTAWYAAASNTWGELGDLAMNIYAHPWATC